MMRDETVRLCAFATTAALLLSAVAAPAATIHVPGDAATIQAGLDAASSGDVVLVSAGTYTENIRWPAVNGIQLVGAGTDVTVVDGNRAASVIRFEDPGLIDETTAIRGLTVTNGFAQPPAPASFGGGIYLFYADPLLQDVVVRGNEADDFGGGVYSWGASPTLQRVEISGNTAISDGGFAAKLGFPELDHVTVSGNSPGGISLDQSTQLALTNSVVSGNGDHAVSVSGNYIFQSSFYYKYSDVRGGIQATLSGSSIVDEGGNIGADPHFVKPIAGNYHLLSTSPCIDAADPALPPDPDGTRSDMGAYPFDQGPTAAPAVAQGPDGAVSWEVRPNPSAGPGTTIAWDLPTSAPVGLGIYDAAGRLVRTLLDGAQQAPSRHAASWDGRDRNGDRVASGTYFVRLVAGSRTETRAVTVIR